MNNDFYGNVGNSDYNTNSANRANNGYYNQYDDNFYNGGPRYTQKSIDEALEKKRKQDIDNIVGAIILLIIIIVLLVIFVITNLDFSFE